MWEGVGDRTELQHIDHHSIGHNRVSFPFSWAAQPGAWGPSLSGTCSSIQHLLSNCNCSIGGLSAHSAGGWLSLLHLVSNWSGHQTNWLPVFAELNNSWPSSCGRHNFALIKPVHGQGYNILIIPRPDAPVIYTGAFPILTAQPGCRSICNRSIGARDIWVRLYLSSSVPHDFFILFEWS